MNNYVSQLLNDIQHAAENISWPYSEKELGVWDWISDEEENKMAPVRQLEEWTGIKKEMLPPDPMLNDKQVHQLVEALKKMLDAYNWSFVIQIEVPERIQYQTIRDNFDQDAKVKRWHMGFFELCRPGISHHKCAMREYCHCALYAELFKDMNDEELTPEEERARLLAIEIEHLKRKFEDDTTAMGWMKYYPYHLDKDYDDENGNPYDYGLDDEDDDTW